MIPVTFEAIVNEAIISRCLFFSNTSFRWFKSTKPCLSKFILCTSHKASLNETSFEWCSYGPTITNGAVFLSILKLNLFLVAGGI